MDETTPATMLDHALAARNGDSADFTRPDTMTPQLLKRLAEASLGPFRKHKLYWVCRFEPDPATNCYDLKGPFRNKKDAEEMLAQVTAENGEGFGLFGPFRRVKGDPVRLLIEKPVAEIVEIKVTVRIVATGEQEEVAISPQKYDALFWGPPAVEKFALPYYTAASGIRYANNIYRDYMDGKAFLLAHSGDTEGRVFRPEDITPEKERLTNQLRMRPL